MEDVRNILKKMYLNISDDCLDKAEKEHAIKAKDDVFINNPYFAELDAALSKPQTEPVLDRSTDIYYFEGK